MMSSQNESARSIMNPVPTISCAGAVVDTSWNPKQITFVDAIVANTE
jgi:hypothetical protein